MKAIYDSGQYLSDQYASGQYRGPGSAIDTPRGPFRWVALDYFPTKVFEQSSGISLMGRGTNLNGTFFRQSDFGSSKLKIFDMAEPLTPINGTDGEDLDPSHLFFNSPVTNDSRWSFDSGGYNFLYVTKAADLPKGGRRYRLEFANLPLFSTDPLWAVFEIPTLGLFSA